MKIPDTRRPLPSAPKPKCHLMGDTSIGRAPAGDVAAIASGIVARCFGPRREVGRGGRAVLEPAQPPSPAAERSNAPLYSAQTRRASDLRVHSRPFAVQFGIQVMAVSLAARAAAIRRPRNFAAFTVFLLALLSVHTSAFAQQQRPVPHIGFVYPAGGQKGSTFTVSIGGQNLNGTNLALFSTRSISATVSGFERPMTQKEFNDLRDKIQELQTRRAAALGRKPPVRPEPQAGKKKAEEEKKKEEAEKAATAEAKPDAPKPTWTPDDEKLLAELRAQVARRPNRQGNPAISETVTLQVTIAPDATPGECELRLKSPTGISNPFVFQIGELPEFTNPVVTATLNPNPRGKRDPNLPPNRPQPADEEITLPTVVNGQILPGEVDRYRFTAQKGQHLTVAVAARRLIPYLADAVPGWFQATLALYDPNGREVAYSDSFRFSPDPVVSYAIPEDGTYAIEIKDSIYRGREDFVYRISIGELPFITSIFPLGGNGEGPATFELSGTNLPAKTATFNPADPSPGTFLLSVRNRGQLSNSVRFALDSEPACRETEPNDKSETAQVLTLPVVVDGRIQTPGDQDVFRFNGKAGQQIVAEVFARRLGSPLDSMLRLTDATGKLVAENDDTEDKGAGLMTHHADSRIITKLPADGSYTLTLTDTQHQGGADYGYRLRVSPPRPDFELRVVPSSINAMPGSHVPITVYALRRDGFDGEIALSIDSGSAGFSLAGARVPAGQDKVQCTLSAPATIRDQLVKMSIVGTASVNGRTLTHEAVPAEDMMQAFAYRHLVPAREMIVDLVGRAGARMGIASPLPLKIPAGGTAELHITAPGARGFESVTAELNDPPAGITVKSTTIKDDTVRVVIACDAAKVKPAQQGNLIVNLLGQRKGAPAQKGKQPQRSPLGGTVPAVMFEVTPGTTQTAAAK